MEHGLLSDPIKAGRANLIHTYLELAKGATTAKIIRTNDHWLVSGPQDLSFCNFAAGFDWCPENQLQFDELVKWSAAHPAFWVFCIDGDSPPDLPARLEARGFALRQNLVQMVSESTSRPVPTAMAQEAMSEADRLAICRFATRTFFTRTRPSAQERIAQATAKSGHRLFQLKDERDMVGAFMLAETKESIGLYNLCIRQDSRNQGLGRNLVRTAQSIAHQENKTLVLQCDPTLVDWYVRWGFKKFGRVRAYTYPLSSSNDIML